MVKRVNPELARPRTSGRSSRLKDGDEVVGAVELTTGEEDLCFVTSDAQLLRFAASRVRPQGRAGGGMAGVKRLAATARVVFFGAVDPRRRTPCVVTCSGHSDALPGTEAGCVKVTPFSEYPAKGRATGGVRCHRFLKGEDALVLAWAGPAPGPRRGRQRRAGRPARGGGPPRRLGRARRASRSRPSPGPSRRLVGDPS